MIQPTLKSSIVRIILFLAICFSFLAETFSQGCVAIRGNSSCSAHMFDSAESMKGVVDLQLNYRYFKSFRHFRGSHEETHRIEEGTEVINNSNFIDFGISYSLSDRWALNAVIPFSIHDRSSMYEHGGNPPNGLGERHTTTSKGLGDIRIGADYWLFKPGLKKFNYATGLAVKLPTGSYDYESLYYNQGDQKDQDIPKVVDQSIQPGDGGLGLALNIRGYHELSSNLSLLNNVYYLFNVEETNGVFTRNGSSEFSCPDQFAVTTGLNYTLNNGINFLLGGRAEGVPSSDLIGGSAGYRRPGYVISVEPGIGYQSNNLSLFCSVPVALYRNRTQSYRDKVRTQETGVYRHGDAAFADYLINFNISYRLGGKMKSDMHHEMPTINDINN